MSRSREKKDIDRWRDPDVEPPWGWEKQKGHDGPKSGLETPLSPGTVVACSVTVASSAMQRLGIIYEVSERENYDGIKVYSVTLLTKSWSWERQADVIRKTHIDRIENIVPVDTKSLPESVIEIQDRYWKELRELRNDV